MENNLLDDLVYLNEEKPKFVYEGLGKRFIATLADFGVLFLILIVFSAILEIFNDLLFNTSITDIQMLLISVISLIYYPITESSSWKGSFGKHLMKMKVIDKQGNKLSLGLAAARTALKFFSYSLLFAGFIMIAFTKNKQGLHDIILETYVVEK